MDPKTRLSEVSAGFQHSVVLLTANKIGIFACLGTGAKPASEVAAELGLDARAVEIVLLALAAEGILVQEVGVESGRSDSTKQRQPASKEALPYGCATESNGAPAAFRLNPDYTPFLLPDSPQTQANILKHNFNMMQRWVRLEETLRTGKPVSAPAAERDADDLRSFICGMADISRASSAEVAEKVDLSSYRKMLDLGGGPGTSSIVFAQKYPDLRCVVFDLPAPVEIAKEQIAKATLEDRIETVAGDYFVDEFGSGFDLVYISNIIHSMGSEDTRMLFEKSHRAMKPGGAIIVKEFFLDDTRTQPAFGAFFSVNMLVGTEAGKSYTLTETEELLRGAGFGEFRTVEVASASRLLIGRQ